MGGGREGERRREKAERMEGEMERDRMAKRDRD